MPVALRRLFRIHEGEEGKVVLFALLAAVLQAGVAVGISLADALFLTNVGAGSLPVVYILLPVIMSFLTPLFSYLTKRIGMDRLVDVVLGTLVLGGLAFYLLLSMHGPWSVRVVSYAVKFYASVWFIYLYTLFWNYADGYFDILDAKRLFCFLTAGMSLGAMVGGVLVALLVPFVAVGGLFILWSLLALLTFPLLRVLQRRYQRIEGEDEEQEQTSFVGQMRRIASACRRSRYVVAMVLLSLCMLFMTTTCEFLYLSVFSDFGSAASGVSGLPLGRWFTRPHSAEELAALFGKLFGAANVFSLVVTLFLFSRIVGFLGVRNTVLIQPLVYLGTFLLFRTDRAYEAALLGFFAYQAILVSIDLNNYNFVLNAVPSEAKKEIRTFMEGLLEPLAGSLAGVFLLIAATERVGRQGMATIGTGMAVLALAAALWLRRDYVTAMVSNLKKGWLDFARTAGAWGRSLTRPDLEALCQAARTGDIKTKHTAVRMLLANDRERALSLVLELVAGAPDDEVRVLMPILTEMLSGEDDEVVRRVLLWLEEGTVVPGPSLVEELGSHGLMPPQSVAGLLSSADPEARGAAAVALWHSWEPGHGQQALELTNELLRGDQERALVAIRAIGRMGQERFTQVLVPCLSAASQPVRLAALSAIRRLATPDSGRLVPHVLQRIEAGDSVERALGMDVLAKVADSRCITRLLLVSDAFTHFERRRAAQVILSMGQRSVPAVVAVFRTPQYPAQARATAARCLGDLLFAEFEALYPQIIEAELQRAYRYLHCHLVLEQELQRRAEAAAAPGMRVLSRFYHDQQRRIIEFVLEVLAIGGRLPDYEMIGAALSSANVKARGNAIETIEQACSRQTFTMLLPLVDSRSLEDRIRFYRRHCACPDLSAAEVVEAAFRSPVPLESAAAAQALYDAAGPDSFGGFRLRLQQAGIPLLRDTIGSLFARHGAPDSTTDGGQGDGNVVEKIAWLSRVPFFGHFGPLELELLARRAVRRTYGAGARLYRRGEDAGVLFAVLHGSVRLEQDGQAAERHPGAVFGEGCLFGEAARAEDAVARSATVLALHRDQVIGDASRSPRLALGLLRARLVGVPPDGEQSAWN